MFGSVSPRDLVGLIGDAGFDVNRNQIALNTPIKTIGQHEVPISLHPEIETTVTVIVARNSDEAARIARGEDVTQLREPTEEEAAVVAAEAFFEPGAGEAARRGRRRGAAESRVGREQELTGRPRRSLSRGILSRGTGAPSLGCASVGSRPRLAVTSGFEARGSAGCRSLTPACICGGCWRRRGRDWRQLHATRSGSVAARRLAVPAGAHGSAALGGLPVHSIHLLFGSFRLQLRSCGGSSPVSRRVALASARSWLLSRLSRAAGFGSSAAGRVRLPAFATAAGAASAPPAPRT